MVTGSSKQHLFRLTPTKLVRIVTVAAILYFAISIVFFRTAVKLQSGCLTEVMSYMLNNQGPSINGSSPTTLSSETATATATATAAGMASTLQHTSIGSLGPKGTSRQHLRYYDSLFMNIMQFGYNAKSILEVGCASDPFLQHLDWIQKRTCVAPFFVDYNSINRTDPNVELKTSQGIEYIQADFMKYQLPQQTKYDLLLCSQVVEHVVNPSAFMKKLIESATTSIISVPYKWPDNCKTQEPCLHISNNITYQQILQWSKPYKPIISSIVAEIPAGRKQKNKTNLGRKRIILVFRS